MRAYAAFVSMVVFVSAVGCNRATVDEDRLHAAAAILHEQFETVFYAKPPVLSKATDGPSAALQMPFASLLNGLSALGHPIVDEVIRSSSAVLVGAKNFQPPRGSSGLGDVLFDFCYIVIARANDSGLDVVLGASPVVPRDDAATWSVAGTEGHPDPRSYFATRVRPAYLLICDEYDELKQVAMPLTDKHRQAADFIPNFAISTADRGWGFRSYNHDAVFRHAAGMSGVAPDADALFLQVASGRTATLRLFSQSSATAEAWGRIPIIPRFEYAMPREWRATMSLGADDEAFEQLITVMGLFGFGVYL